MAPETTINLADAYRAMFYYLEAYWTARGKSEDEIASLLTSMEYGQELGPEHPLDPAMWDEWIDAVKAIQS